MSEESQVRAFYTGKNFFITGGTGFVGLCLIEKILRTIPDVGKLYLLMRPKKGKEITERLEEFPKQPVFEKLIEKQTTEVFKKLIPISGDVGEDNLGLSSQDRQLLIDSVNVVLHSAATLDFQDNLRPTVKINLLGTRRVMELCREIKDLKVMIHVSSAYVNSYLTEAHEKVYETPADAEKLIEMVNSMTDEALDAEEPNFACVKTDPSIPYVRLWTPDNVYAKFNDDWMKHGFKAILKSHPNTYTFTKHLAEHEVVKCVDLFPCTIVRPTMIVAAWKEPIPGWTCSKVGPQGFLMGASKGVVRRLPLAVENVADYIPVDVVVNQLLVAGWHAAKSKSGLSVYHCSSSTCKPFKWAMMESSINGTLHQYPLKSAVWYPHLKFVPSLWLFRLSAIFVHFFPAVLLDLVLRCTGGRPILFRLHKNVWSSLARLEKFIFSEWKFHNPNTLDLSKQLNSTDSETFFIDISTLQWKEYFTNLHLGVRRYLNKEKDSTLEAARGKDTILLVFHVLWQILIVGSLWYLFAGLTGLSMTQSAWVAPVVYILYSCL